ncbi:hypothetical protein [Cytobacillus firmus]|uniref:Uncharacterized protein n=1 Tax=Cytobacillus firmus DS1 TaxID=1307436 RepID=W7KLT9_CYTFI|nr:hypothetical protein [Cytobacillus firmus]EWG08370.1 hypothetical protein PBF_24613 [Cytobacillus firmus DS1]
MYNIPVIPDAKNYWLIRTQGGKYYHEFRRKGYIGINWEEITLDDITRLNADELTLLVKEHYPDKSRPGTTANQLRTFKNVIKKGDTVVITGVASNKFSIGEVVDDDCYSEEVPEEALEANPKLCPYNKRRKVRWIKEVHKWDVEMPMFKLLQHAQHTITDANEYKDVIESMIHDFYIRGDYAQLSLKVKKEGHIPAVSFFALGKDILDLANEFMEYSKENFADLEEIETQINVNSPGKVKFKGPMKAILVVGLIIVVGTGGGVTVTPPGPDGPGSFEVQSNGLLREVNAFLNDRQEREHREMIMSEYMDDLEVETPEELEKLMSAIENNTENKSEN